jgi:hypothetical protein
VDVFATNKDIDHTREDDLEQGFVTYKDDNGGETKDRRRKTGEDARYKVQGRETEFLEKTRFQPG